MASGIPKELSFSSGSSRVSYNNSPRKLGQSLIFRGVRVFRDTLISQPAGVFYFPVYPASETTVERAKREESPLQNFWME